MSESERHQVRWVEAAVADLEEITSYVAADSPVNAEKLLARLRSSAGSLEGSPRRGRVVPELAQFGIRTWRELLVRPYRIVYRISEKVVFVLAVFDGRRELSDVLLERLLRS